MSVVRYTCPVDGKEVATLENGNLIIKGNLTMGNDYKCSDHNVALLANGCGQNAGGITASVGGTTLQPGDWLVTDGDAVPGAYQHHFMYVGDGEFVSRQRKPGNGGVLLEQRSVYEGKKAAIVHSGGQSVADAARRRVGETGFNLLTKNCEHFCSEVCGMGTKSVQALVGTGKLTTAIALTVASFAGNSSSNNVSFRGGISGGFSACRGGFSGGIGFNL